MTELKHGMFKLFALTTSLLILQTMSVRYDVSNDSRRPLYILASGPYPDPLEGEGAWAAGISLVAAVRVAFHHINNNTSILPGYRLEALEDDSGCRVSSKALLSFYQTSFYSDKNVVGIVGPGCSESTLLVAPLLARSDISIVQIAPSATSPKIQQSGQNTTFTMINPFSMDSAFIATMRNNEWKRIVIVYDVNRDLFTELQSEVSRQISAEHDLEITDTLIFTDGSTEAERIYPIDSLRRSETRVILVLMEPVPMQRFLCVALRNRLYYPRYQWVILEKNLNEIIAPLETFTYNGEDFNCTYEDLARAADRAIITQYQFKQDSSSLITPNNIVFKKYREDIEQEFHEHFNETRVQAAVRSTNIDVSRLKPQNDWENLYYDAAWALGLALDGAAKRGVNLSNYMYGQPENTKILTEELFKVDFEGSVGPVQFSVNRTVISPVVLSQLWNNESVGLRAIDVALYVRGRLLRNGSDFVYISDTFDEIENRIHPGLNTIVIVITFVLTVLVAILQSAFIYWRNKKSVRATSPGISHLIFSGCYLLSITTILFGLQKTLNFNTPLLRMQYSVICNVITWCLLLGFSLIFGTVFVKVWRVFRLFRHFRNERPGILLSDQVLVTAVTALVIVDTIICLVWNSIDPWLLKKTRLEEESQNQTVTINLTCSCSYDIYWISIIAGYKGLITLLLVIFSVLNRQVKRKHFSHTKKVNVLVYSLTIMGGVGFPLYFLLAVVSIYVSYVIFSAVLLLTIVMCCLMLFMPPIWPVIKGRLEDNNEWGTVTSLSLSRRLSSQTTLVYPS